MVQLLSSNHDTPILSFYLSDNIKISYCNWDYRVAWLYRSIRETKIILLAWFPHSASMVAVGRPTLKAKNCAIMWLGREKRGTIVTSYEATMCCSLQAKWDIICKACVLLCDCCEDRFEQIHPHLKCLSTYTSGRQGWSPLRFTGTSFMKTIPRFFKGTLIVPLPPQ